MTTEHDSVELLFPKRIEDMEDAEVIELYYSSLSHPSVSKKPYLLAEAIISHAGQADITGSEQNQRFQKRVAVIKRATADPSDSQWDSLIDIHSEQYDAAFSDIVLALQQMKGDENIIRDALFVLLDMRVTSLRLKQKDSAAVEQMVAFLVAGLDSNQSE